MKIILSPINSAADDEPPAISGDTITYRGETYDLSQLPDGGEVEAELPFVGPIRRTDGSVHATLQYRYSTTTAYPVQSTDIADYTFDVVEGECPDPIQRKETPND